MSKYLALKNIHLTESQVFILGSSLWIGLQDIDPLRNAAFKDISDFSLNPLNPLSLEYLTNSLLIYIKVMYKNREQLLGTLIRDRNDNKPALVKLSGIINDKNISDGEFGINGFALATLDSKYREENIEKSEATLHIEYGESVKFDVPLISFLNKTLKAKKDFFNVRWVRIVPSEQNLTDKMQKGEVKIALIRQYYLLARSDNKNGSGIALLKELNDKLKKDNNQELLNKHLRFLRHSFKIQALLNGDGMNRNVFVKGLLEYDRILEVNLKSVIDKYNSCYREWCSASNMVLNNNNISRNELKDMYETLYCSEFLALNELHKIVSKLI